MNNRLANDFNGSAKQYYGRPEKQLMNRLDTLLLVTKGCKQDGCRDPWGELFPGGKVTSLKDAMKPEWDQFFANQPKVSFSGCFDGHQIRHEGPQEPRVYHS